MTLTELKAKAQEQQVMLDERDAMIEAEVAKWEASLLAPIQEKWEAAGFAQKDGWRYRVHVIQFQGPSGPIFLSDLLSLAEDQIHPWGIVHLSHMEHENPVEIDVRKTGDLVFRLGNPIEDYDGWPNYLWNTITTNPRWAIDLLAMVTGNYLADHWTRPNVKI